MIGMKLILPGLSSKVTDTTISKQCHYYHQNHNVYVQRKNK